MLELWRPSLLSAVGTVFIGFGLLCGIGGSIGTLRSTDRFLAPTESRELVGWLLLGLFFIAVGAGRLVTGVRFGRAGYPWVHWRMSPWSDHVADGVALMGPFLGLVVVVQNDLSTTLAWVTLGVAALCVVGGVLVQVSGPAPAPAPPEHRASTGAW